MLANLDNALLLNVFKLAVDVSINPILVSWERLIVASDELNVEYPVVPVISTWIDPEITPSLSSLFLIVVLIELVKTFKLPDETSKADTLLLLLDVYEFKAEVYEFKEDVNELMELEKLFKLPLDVSKEDTLGSLLAVYELNTVSSNLPVIIWWQLWSAT